MAWKDFLPDELDLVDDSPVGVWGQKLCMPKSRSQVQLAIYIRIKAYTILKPVKFSIKS